MSKIVTVTWNDGSAQEVTFDSFEDGSTRNFIDFVPSGNVQDNKRFSMPGVDGNFLIRGGFRGLSVAVLVRYKDTLANCTAKWKADREAFAKYSCAVDDGQTYYTRCTLRSDSAQRTTGEKASGNVGYGDLSDEHHAFFDVRYVWDVDEL